METLLNIRRRLSVCVCLFVCLPVALYAQTDQANQIKLYADKYGSCVETGKRLQLANDFFSYLLETNYIDEPIVFPRDSHIDSVDVNVYYYAAEYFYGEGDYRQATDYCTLATTHLTDKVDAVSKSDVYALLGAAYFRLGAYDDAAKALLRSYEIDKKQGDYDRLSSTLNSIASVFVAAGKPDEAEKYLKEAIAANSLTNNLSRRAVLYGTASELYRNLGADAIGAGASKRRSNSPNYLQTSLDYAEKALATERLLGDTAHIGVRLSQLAGAQLALSQTSEAKRSLQEAIPLLLSKGNLRSWGICQNQMGDILSGEGRNDEAATYYLDAAMLFMEQGDRYNEMHAREGLYRTMKKTSPSEAMLHMERAVALHDSIYQQETSEAISRYNAIYYNDILLKGIDASERRNRDILMVGIVLFALLLVIIGIAIPVTLLRHRRKMKSYKEDITSLQEQYDTISSQYQKVVSETTQMPDGLTDDDRAFIANLTNVIYVLTEQGTCDIDTIVSQMHINPTTLQRRLAQTLAVTPKTFILKARMQKAMYLLQNYRDISIADVAYKCGYAQLPNFTRAFTRYYNITPTEAKK